MDPFAYPKRPRNPKRRFSPDTSLCVPEHDFRGGARPRISQKTSLGAPFSACWKSIEKVSQKAPKRCQKETQKRQIKLKNNDRKPLPKTTRKKSQKTLEINLSWHGNGKRAQRGDTRPREEKTRRSNRKGEHTRTQTNTREHKETQGTTSTGKETQLNRSARFARFARSLAALVQGKGTQGATREHKRAQGDTRNPEEQKVLKCPRHGNTRQDKVQENSPKPALRNLPK